MLFLGSYSRPSPPNGGGGGGCTRAVFLGGLTRWTIFLIISRSINVLLSDWLTKK